MLADYVLRLQEDIKNSSDIVNGKQNYLVLNGSFAVKSTSIIYAGRVSAIQGGVDVLSTMPPDIVLPDIRDYFPEEYRFEDIPSFLHVARFDVEVAGKPLHIRREAAAIRRAFRKQIIATTYTF
ncbi:MAG: hypothetical protein AABW61_01580 [Candidatus Aenigmatarchaeota archaeon]